MSGFGQSNFEFKFTVHNAQNSFSDEKKLIHDHENWNSRSFNWDEENLKVGDEEEDMEQEDDSELIPSKEKQKIWVHAPKTHHKLVDYNKIGKWMLFLDRKRENEDGLTQLDLYWFLIRDLVRKGILYNAKCSTASPYGKYPTKNEGVILCLTTDYTDKNDIKLAADFIREVVHYPNVMYYKADDETVGKKYCGDNDKPAAIYYYTLCGKLYEKHLDKKWHLVDSNRLEAELPDSQSSPLASVPTQVTDVKWLYAEPLGQNLPQNARARTPYLYGKWLLFSDANTRKENGLTEFDEHWQAIAKLAEDGVLKMAKCTTAITDYNEKCIMCYTADCYDKKEVKTAADAIRKVVCYHKNMYYKTSSAMYMDQLQVCNERALTIYEHTPELQLYERNESNQWQLVEFPE